MSDTEKGYTSDREEFDDQYTVCNSTLISDAWVSISGKKLLRYVEAKPDRKDWKKNELMDLFKDVLQLLVFHFGRAGWPNCQTNNFGSTGQNHCSNICSQIWKSSQITLNTMMWQRSYNGDTIAANILSIKTTEPTDAIRTLMTL